MEFVMRLGMRLVFGILLAAAWSGPLLAQESGPAGNGNAPYFRGKQIRILLSAGVAGGYAEYGRLLTQHLGNHIAGQADFIVQSIPGLGRPPAASSLYSQAPVDGTGGAAGSMARSARRSTRSGRSARNGSPSARWCGRS